ncbi:MAG TPA: DUF998 domain-containing protein [Terriglobia bacterium]|nr:DUF998 domain-containing protein [Terriglobia bacterium]
MSKEAGDEWAKLNARLNLVVSYVTIISIVYYVIAILLLHLLRTDYDPGYRYLSEYVVGPYGALMTSTFFVLSIGSLALSLGLWRSVSSKLRFLPGHLFWLAWACAVFLAGIYPGDLQGSPQTRIGQIHNQMGAVAFPSAALALLLLSFPLRWEQRWRPLWGTAVVLSLAVVVCFWMWDRLEGIRLGGLDQRVFLSITLAWMLILARKLLAIGKQRKE